MRQAVAAARAHGGSPDTGLVGAAEHDESTTAAAATVQEQSDAGADANGPRAELFEHGQPVTVH